MPHADEVLGRIYAHDHTTADRTGPQTNDEHDGFIELAISSAPSAPATGKMRIYAEDAAGVARLRALHSTGTNLAFFRDSATRVRNETGATISKGSAVYVTGSNGQVPTIAKAKADSVNTVPSLGLVISDIANNGFGTVQFGGQLGNLDTSAYSVGDKLYLSATTAGALTNVEPTLPSISQLVCLVITSSAGNGIVFIFPEFDTHGDEPGTIRNSFTIGDGTAGNKDLIYTAAFTGTLRWAPTTSNKVVTIPDATGTVVLLLGNGYLATGSTTVGSLPAAATAGAGARHFVTDANATTFNSVVAAGGANKVPVFSDGAAWRIG